MDQIAITASGEDVERGVCKNHDWYQRKHCGRVWLCCANNCSFPDLNLRKYIGRQFAEYTTKEADSERAGACTNTHRETAHTLTDRSHGTSHPAIPLDHPLTSKLLSSPKSLPMVNTRSAVEKLLSTNHDRRISSLSSLIMCNLFALQLVTSGCLKFRICGWRFRPEYSHAAGERVPFGDVAGSNLARRRCVLILGRMR